MQPQPKRMKLKVAPPKVIGSSSSKVTQLSHKLKLSVYPKICVQSGINLVCANNEPNCWAELKSKELHCEYDSLFSLYFFLFDIKEKAKVIHYVIFRITRS